MSLSEKRVTVRTKFHQYDLTDPGVVVMSARKGLKPSLFYGFSSLVNIPEKELASLINLHPRTIGNYRDQGKALAAVESEHLLKLIALFAKGEELFGNTDEFRYWMQKPFWSKKEKPIDYLNTPGGVDLVSDELDRLAHGYVV